VGVEYGFQGRFFLRGGFKSLFLADREGGLSGGVGLRQELFYGGEVRLDYAYRDTGRLGGSHIVGLSVTF
jgi:hypothetical protein